MKKRVLAMLLVVVMLVGMLPVTALAADPITVTSDTTTWDGTSLNVTGNVTIESAVTMTADTVLTLADGASLTVTGGISGEGKTLTVNVGTLGTGELTVTGANGSKGMPNGDPGGNGVTGNVTVNGGTVAITGGMGGEPYMSAGQGATGGTGITGNVTVTGGTLTITGGNGYLDKGQGSSGGFGVSGGTVTVSGEGSVTLIGGTGRNSGRNPAFSGENTAVDASVETSADGSPYTPWNGTDALNGFQYLKLTAKAPAVAHTHTVGNETITFTAWKDASKLPAAAGDYYLDTDVTLDATWNVPTGNPVNLCLNGHVIKQTAQASVITVGSEATLNLYDCDTKTEHKFGDNNGLWTWDDTLTGAAVKRTVTGGVITGGKGNVIDANNDGGGVYVTSGGSFTMNGGTISGNKADRCYGGGVYNAGNFTLENGTICGNTGGNSGGGVYNAGTFTMNNGAINENYSTQAGGGVTNNGTMDMTGGTISGNKVGTSAVGTCGGVYIDTSGTFTMTGGTISGNKAGTSGTGTGGGVYVYTKKTTIGGTAQITGNTKGAGEKEAVNNLYLYNNKITLAGSPNAPTENMKIGVTTSATPTESAPVAFTTNGASTDTDYFTPDNANYEIKFNTDHLELAVIPPHTHVDEGGDNVCDECKKDLYIDRSWDETNKVVVETLEAIPSDAVKLTDQTTLDAGKWYVVEGSDVTISTRITVSGTMDNPTRIILKDGAKLTASAGITVEQGSALAIYGQSADSGKLIAAGSVDGYEAAIGGGHDPTAFSGYGAGGTAGAVTVYGGDVTATGGDYGAGIGGGSGYYPGHGGTVIVYGGNVNATGNDSAAGIGGGFGYMAGNGGAVTVYDGNVTATGGDYGAGIGGGRYGSGGTVDIHGGIVTATGGLYAAGIGGGDSNGAGGTVAINGGIVTAISGGSGAAGIGAGVGIIGSHGSLTVSTDLEITAGADADHATVTTAEAYIASPTVYAHIAPPKPITHSLKVQKLDADGKTVIDAVESEDYEWDGNTLTILKDGLIVSGKTTTESIVVDLEVSTLTLSGVIIAPEDSGKIDTGIKGQSHEKDLTITLVGENRIGNTIPSEADASDYFVKNGIVYGKNITFTGAGSLTIYDQLEGIHADGNVIFDDNFSGTLTIDDYGAEPVCAIRATGNVELSGGTFDIRSHYTNGIYADGNVTIDNAKNVSIVAPEKAIYAGGSVTIDDATVTINSGREALDPGEGVGKVGICAGTGNVTISGKADVAVGGQQCAIYAESGNITIGETADDEVKVQADSYKDAIRADNGNITIAAGTVKAMARQWAIAAGNSEIGTGNITISGSKTKVIAYGGVEGNDKTDYACCCGIYAVGTADKDGKVTIKEGASVTAKGFDYGIGADNDVLIQSTMTGVSAEGGYNVTGEKKNDSKEDTREAYGVFSKSGKITVRGGTVVAHGCDGAFNRTPDLTQYKYKNQGSVTAAALAGADAAKAVKVDDVTSDWASSKPVYAEIFSKIMKEMLSIDGTENKVQIAGKDVTDAKLSCYGIKYDKDKKILTLDGLMQDMSSNKNSKFNSAISLPDGITISLAGKNTITAPKRSSSAYGVYSAGELTILGTGSLSVSYGDSTTTTAIEATTLNVGAEGNTATIRNAKANETITSSKGAVTGGKLERISKDSPVVIEFLPIITNGAPQASVSDNHGYLIIDKDTAAANDTVTVMVKPSNGYLLKVDSLKVYKTGDTETTVSLTPDNDDTTKYTFIMPAYAVTVTAVFEELTPWQKLQKAINDATDGVETTVTLTENVTAAAEDTPLTIKAGKKIVLDLAGFTLTTPEKNDGFWNAGSLVIQNSSQEKTGTIDGKNAPHTGIYNYNSGSAELKSGTMTGFKSSAVSTDANASFTMSGGTIKDCYSPNYGGAVKNKGAFTMTGGTIQNCESNGHGGAIYSESAKTVTISGGTIDSCKAAANGGAIFLQSGKVTVNGATIQKCTAAANGGAIFIESGAEVELKSGTLDGNKALVGGGVSIGAGGTFTMSGGTVKNNEANENQGGGGIWGCGTFKLEGGEVSGNKAKSGAGVYLSYANGTTSDTDTVFFTMTDGTIKNNIASDKGGGVYVDNYDIGMIMTGGAITGNDAGTMGGGVCCNTAITLGGTAKITGNTVKTAANNVFLRNNSKKDYQPQIILSTTTVPVTEGENKMSVGVTSEIVGVFTGANGADYSALFTPDAGADYKVINLASDSNKLKLVKKYAVTVDTGIQNGTVTTDAANNKAFECDTVTITVTPGTNYQLKANSLLVKYNDGAEKTITPQATQTAGEYTFTMPAYAVTVTAEFAEFVAKIGSTGYTSLTEALAAAKSGNTVTLLKDITLTEQLIIDKKITFNGNGKTITRTPNTGDASTRAGILVTAGATIINLTVDGPNTTTSGWDEGEFGIKFYNANGATMDEVTVKNANAGIQVNGGKVYLTGNIDVSGNEFGGIELCKSGELDISNATLKNDGETDANPILWNDDTKGTLTQNTSQMLYVKAADANKDHYYLSGEAQLDPLVSESRVSTGYRSVTEALAAAKSGNTVTLLKDITESTMDVTVLEGAYFDLNHHVLKTTGTVVNNGCIILHKENADVIDYLLYNVPGNYATKEELKLPNDAAPDYVIPARTFMTAKVGTNPAYQELGFASGDEMLVWNKDVPAGMQLDVVYSLMLGGDILSAKTEGIKETNVTAVNFALGNDITIGSNAATDGAATLTVMSLYDEEGDHAYDTIASFAANGKKITLNKTGKLVISSDADGFSESVLVSGVQGMRVTKTEDETAGTVTYFIETPAPAAGEGYTIDYAAEKVTVKQGYEISKSKSPFSAETLTDAKMTVEPNTTYYIRKAAAGEAPASAAVEFTTPNRPAAPSGVTAAEETVENKKDGALSGITEAMEYSTDNGTTWTPCPETLTGFSNETVKVRYKATTTAFKSEEYSYTFTPSTATLTVSFSDNAESKQLAYGALVPKPADPEQAGYTFGGWYTDEKLTQAWNFELDTVTEDMTLYPKWIRNAVQKAAITGKVTESSTGVPGATVELFLGTVKVAATVTKDSPAGDYSFDNVENGIYNIVVTKDGKTKTEMVTVDTAGTFEKDVELPDKAISSVVEVQPTEVGNVKSDISKTVVGGLDEIAKNTTVSGADKVTIKLTVVPKDESEVPSATEIKQTAGNGKKVEFLDMSLWKQVNTDKPNDIGDSNTQLLTIVIPFDFSGVDVSSVMIIRKHGEGPATTLTTTPNNDGEYFTVDRQAGTITLYAMKFSDYALAYEEKSSSGGGSGTSSYAIESESAKNGTFSADKKSASAGSTVTITVAPDKGFTLETLTVLDKNGKKIEVKSLGNNKYSFTMPSGKVTVSATFMEDNTMLNFFVDVKATDYYYDAVLWAAESGITKGTDAVHFSPNMGTTRAQVVTFLWRAAGCPEPKGDASKFVDVEVGSYYEKAVAWAIEQVITKGTSDTTFSPDMVCTRGQIVTFLARFAGIADEATGYTHGFTDVKATDYFNNAVAWAKDNKVTEGTSATTFSPNADCTRAQVVTFLYRWMVR